MGIFDKTHGPCAQCGAFVSIETLVAFPWKRKPGQRRMMICAGCASQRRVEENRSRHAAQVRPPSASATVSNEEG